MKRHPPLSASLESMWLNFTRPPRPWNKIRVVKTLFPELHARLLDMGTAPPSAPTRQMALFK